MEMSLRLPEYRGIEDAIKHVHMCEILWCTKGITDFEHKECHFITTLQVCTHSLYINFDHNQTCVDYVALWESFLKDFLYP